SSGGSTTLFDCAPIMRLKVGTVSALYVENLNVLTFYDLVDEGFAGKNILVDQRLCERFGSLSALLSGHRICPLDVEYDLGWSVLLIDRHSLARCGYDQQSRPLGREAGAVSSTRAVAKKADTARNSKVKTGFRKSLAHALCRRFLRTQN